MENNNNQEMNFESFYENMLNSLQEKNKEIDFENTNLMSIQNTLNKHERLDVFFTNSLVPYLFIGYYLVEYSPNLALGFLLALLVVKGTIHRFYLDSLKEYLQKESQIKAKIAEKETLLTLCSSFGIEIPEFEEDNERAR